MSAEDIVSVKQNFVRAAIRAQCAGYAAIEIHATHSYLISEFLSPRVNLRDDEYGGSFENRTKFLKEILSAVRIKSFMVYISWYNHFTICHQRNRRADNVLLIAAIPARSREYPRIPPAYQTFRRIN